MNNSGDVVVQVNGNEIYAGSEEGEVGVWKVTPEGHYPTTLYFMEPGSASYVPLRRMSALIESQGKCYIGDSGPNIKVLAWRNSKSYEVAWYACQSDEILLVLLEASKCVFMHFKDSII